MRAEIAKTVIVDFNDLQGDAIKNKIGSFAIKIIEIMQELGGHENCHILSKSDGLLLSILDCAEDYDKEYIKEMEELPQDIQHIGWLPLANAPIFVDESISVNSVIIVSTRRFNPIEQIAYRIDLDNSPF